MKRILLFSASDVPTGRLLRKGVPARPYGVPVALFLALAFQAYSPTVDAACILRFTSPGDGASVRTARITVYGQGGADVQHGDSGTVTARLNGATFFTYSGSFTAAVSFLESRGVAVTLRPGLNFLTVTGSAGSCSASDSMTVLYDPAVELSKNKGEPDELSCNAPSSLQGNPINIAVGNKFQREEDFRGAGSYPLHFARNYNSLDGYWRHNYSVRLAITSSQVKLIRADGRESTFTVNSSTVVAEPTELGILQRAGTGWRYTSPQREILDFDSQGRLTRIANLNGQFHELTYSSSGVTVTDAFGGTLLFTEDDRRQPLTLNTGGVSVIYTYDSTARLTSITKVAGGQSRTRSYHYENAGYPRFLTGITDERGIRYVTWQYDNLGRATKSVYAGGADAVTLTYNSDGSTTVTNAMGRPTTYRYAVIEGVKRITAIEGEPTRNCPASNATFTYDSRGLIKTKTDNRGFITRYDYDERGLETARTEAAGTPEERRITTVWHPSLFLPREVATPDRITLYSYDEQGRLIGQTVKER